MLESNGFRKTRHVSNTEQSITLATAESRSSTVQVAPGNQVNVVRFSKSTPVTQKLEDGLKRAGWTTAEHAPPFTSLKPKNIVLVTDDLSSPLFPSIREEQWEGIKALSQVGSRIL